MECKTLNEDWVPAWILRQWREDKGDPSMLRLRRALVSAGEIQAPANREPRLSTVTIEAPPVSANIPLAPAASRAFSARPVPSGGAMNLHSLGDFSWGGVSRRIGANATPQICGDHLVIVLTEGSLRVDLPRRHHILSHAGMVFVPVGTAFSLWQAPRAQGQVINIPSSVLRKLSMHLPADLQIGRLKDRDLAGLPNILDQLSRIKRPLTPANMVTTRHWIGMINSLITRLEPEPVNPVHSSADLTGARPVVERFIALARRDMGRGMTIADFALEIGVSSSTLERTCRQLRGRSALELLYELRLERAVALLREGRCTPVEIAERVGYAGLSHMNRAFAAATGRGPEFFQYERPLPSFAVGDVPLDLDLI